MCPADGVADVASVNNLGHVAEVTLCVAPRIGEVSKVGIYYARHIIGAVVRYGCAAVVQPPHQGEVRPEEWEWIRRM